MQRNEMSLIDGVLGALQPVAVIMAGADMALAVFTQEQIVVGQQRRGLRADVSKYEPADLLRLISRMLQPIFEAAIARFRRLLETLALGIVEPAVVTAADSGVFDPTEL